MSRGAVARSVTVLLSLLPLACQGERPGSSLDRGPEPREDAVASARDLVLDERVGALAAKYLAERPAGALVVGIHREGRDRVLGYGSAGPGAGAPDGDSIFEIGSITKVFTGILLARLAAEGVVALDDPIARCLPGLLPPDDPRAVITLRQLATHTSGLPRLPANFWRVVPAASSNPYAGYTRAHLEADLVQVPLAHPPGTRADYSNYGAALLGDLLARAADRPYEELLAAEVIAPLGLGDTRLGLDDERRARLVPGHAPGGASTANWDFDVFAPAGGLRSTADDLLRFIRANLAPGEAALGRALSTSREVHTPAGIGPIGLGWHRLELQGRAVWWHNGGTGGYASFLAIDPAARTGVVVLANHGDALAGVFAVDEIGVSALGWLGE